MYVLDWTTVSRLPTGVPLTDVRPFLSGIPCRRRKVRCDLGSVDDPHDPPCVRCRRESKDCFFSATRRKRRPTDGGGGGSADEDDAVEAEIETDYEVRNGRKRVRVRDSDLSSIPTNTDQVLRPVINSSVASTASTGLYHPLTPGGSTARLQPLRRPGSQSRTAVSPRISLDGDQHGQERYSPDLNGAIETPADTGVEDQHLTAEKLLHTEVYSGHDALNLLFEAAGRSGDIARAREDSQAQSKMSPTVHAAPFDTRSTAGSGRDDGVSRPYVHLPEPKREEASVPIDPAISDPSASTVPATTHETEPSGCRPALRAWSSCRFVRAGWFTAREAIALVS